MGCGHLPNAPQLRRRGPADCFHRRLAPAFPVWNRKNRQKTHLFLCLCVAERSLFHHQNCPVIRFCLNRGLSRTSNRRSPEAWLPGGLNRRHYLRPPLDSALENLERSEDGAAGEAPWQAGSVRIRAWRPEQSSLHADRDRHRRLSSASAQVRPAFLPRRGSRRFSRSNRRLGDDRFDAGVHHWRAAIRNADSPQKFQLGHYILL